MFPAEILAAYLAAVLVVIIAPGPDNILAVGCGLSQGRVAAQLSGWLSRRPKVIAVANVGAGLTFVAAGLSILALERRK